jgi:hypothetical protein
MNKPLVLVDAETAVLYVPHIGITLRTLLATAALTGIDKRNWKISYKGVIIGSIRIKNNFERD